MMQHPYRFWNSPPLVDSDDRRHPTGSPRITRRNPPRMRRLPARYRQGLRYEEGPTERNTVRDVGTMRAGADDTEMSDGSIVEAMLLLNISGQAPMDVDTRESLCLLKET